jgi:tight adherence protein C
MTLLVITFLAMFGLAFSIILLLFYRNAAMGRLAAIIGQSSEGVFSRMRRQKPASVAQVIKPFENILPRSSVEVSIIQKRLIRAGYRKSSAVNLFYGTKVLVPLVLSAIVTATGAYRVGGLFAYGLALGLGFLLPDFWLGNRIGKRQGKIRLGLPEALDLMVICTEAGLGLDQTLQRTAREIKLNQPELADELGLILLEQKAGRPRSEALKNFADRADLNTVRALTTTLIQSDSFGTSIAKTLRVYSDSLRTQRRQQAEEMAAKTTVKLVLPLVFFIFPSIFLVALGPSIISMFEGFEKYLSY